VFPGNYVQMVRLPASMKAAPPRRGAVKSPTTTCNSPSTSPSQTVDNTEGLSAFTTTTGIASTVVLPVDSRSQRSASNRTHNFPKTSPYFMDSHSARNLVSQGSHNKTPSKTITNVTQALSRCMVSITSLGSQSQGCGSRLSVDSTITTQAPSRALSAGVAVMGSDKSRVCANPGATNHSPKPSR
jgi:hypothetical protein